MDHWQNHDFEDDGQVRARTHTVGQVLGPGVPTEQLANEAHQRNSEAAKKKRKGKVPKPGPPKSPFKLGY
jgi:hypothetical protein